MNQRLKHKTLLIIAGPTAVGKTAAAVDLAKTLNTEIISADSRQFFKHMPIGTAVPTMEERQGVQHHFLEFLEPTSHYSVGDFAAASEVLVQELLKKYSIVIATGGSGLYLKSLYHGFDTFPSVPQEIREKVNRLYEEKGIEFLQHLIQEKDTEFAAGTEFKNPQRLKRALEVFWASGNPISSFKGNAKPLDLPYRVRKIVLDLPREVLYNRINKRVDLMVEKGLKQEAEQLLPLRNYNALNTVGYKEYFEYFDGLISEQEAIDKIKQHTRNYAKRQLTWFRKESDWKFINPADLEKSINRILE
ncbi:MAG: tRNA (adenosine(37)-N6)-dimethylallyltransferase MiaA [Luteibaculaceae bacterium]